MIDDAIRRSSLLPSAIDLIGLTVGPGSFTGIRVSLSAARGIALATQARLIGVSGFEAVAANLARPVGSTPGYLLIALESRREDLYIQIFDRAGGAPSEPRAVMPALLGAVLDESIGEAPVFIAGDAAERAASALSRRPGMAVIEASAPDAAGVLRAVRRRWRAGERGGKLLPLYLRAPDVTLPTSRRGVRGASRRIEPISPVMAGAVSMLHGACFRDDPWDTPAIVGIMRIRRVLWLDRLGRRATNRFRSGFRPRRGMRDPVARRLARAAASRVRIGASGFGMRGGEAT